MIALVTSVLFLAFCGHFAPVNADYDIRETNRMVDFALASYCCGNLGSGCNDWTCQACKRLPDVTNVTQFKSDFGDFKDGNGFVAYDPVSRAITIAFAGTDPLSIENWIDDIDTVKEDYPACSGCEVHRGFYETYKAVQDQVWQAVEKYWNAYGKDIPLQFTGHSMGASLAAHAALDFYDIRGTQPQWVYTYGQPRVGNDKWEEYYYSVINTHYRVTHGRDPIPHLPPTEFGFRHMPLEVFYEGKGNGTYVVCDGSGADPKCSDQYWVDLSLIDHLTYIGYSFTENYLGCKF